MIKNYFKIAWRNLKSQPFFTFLNVMGLVIGIAGSLLIALYIYDELNYDNMYTDANRIQRINIDVKFGGEVTNGSEVSAPIAGAILNDYPQVELVTRFRNRGSALVKAKDTDTNVKEAGTTLVDPTFFDMFGFDLLYGDKNTALKEANTLILTKTAAEKHFNTAEAVGKSVVLNNDETYVVTGVIDDMPKNSLLRNHSVFMSMTGVEEANEDNWGSNNFATFVKLRPDAKIKDFDIAVQSLFNKYIIPWAQDFVPGITEEQFIASGNFYNFSTTNIKDIHLYSNRRPELSPNGSIQNVYILSFIALFLIVLASVNFMNLSTAQSLKRAKEVGIRKTLGSKKVELIGQFLVESGLITFISLFFAIVVAAIAMPFFNGLADKDISMPFTNPIFWIILIVFGVVLGILSGLYPAFFMSKFKPVKVLKGSSAGSLGGKNIRNSLVVFQFAISVFLMISTLVVFKQLKYIQNKELGYSKDHVLVIEDVYAAGNQVQTFKQKVKQLAQVQHATLSGFLPTPSGRSDSSFFEEGKTSQDHAIQMQQWRADFDYVSTLGLEIIAGRDFDNKFSTDSTAILINEAAVAVMGVTPEEALGKRVTSDFNEEAPVYYTIIGVVKDFHFKSLKDNIGALCIGIGRFSSTMALKLEAGNFTNTISQIEKIWKSVAPGQPFSYYFMEESFNDTYKAEQRLGSIFTIFTILSIIIACLGLFGLATFNAERRAKEIGVRKVLGASVSQITYKLAIDFLKLVLLAILISIPFAWYAMSKWLEDFSYRIEIGWAVFAIVIILAIAISLITVSYQSIKAAIVNPVKSLRTE